MPHFPRMTGVKTWNNSGPSTFVNFAWVARMQSGPNKVGHPLESVGGISCGRFPKNRSSFENGMLSAKINQLNPPLEQQARWSSSEPLDARGGGHHSSW